MNTLADKLSRAGMTASFLCAIECSLTPLAVLILPLVVGSQTEISSRFFPETARTLDWILMGIVGCLALGSQILTIPIHRRPAPLILSGVGFMLMMYGRVWWENGQAGESLFMISGAGVLIGAGWLNRRLHHQGCRLHTHTCSTGDKPASHRSLPVPHTPTSIGDFLGPGKNECSCIGPGTSGLRKS
jgi:hypothetical protein